MREPADETAKLREGFFGVLIALGVVLLVRFWVLNSVPWPAPWVERAVLWLANTGLLVVAGAAALWGLRWAGHRHRSALDRRQETERGAVAAHEARRAVREQARSFAAFLETEYSWVLHMPVLQQKARALRWHDRITATWKDENREFAKIVGSDDYEAVAIELGPVIERMAAIWHGRTRIYQYATAWSDDVERAAELLRVQRAIQQLKVKEAREQRKFADTITETRRALPEHAATVTEIDWAKRPTTSAPKSARRSGRRGVAS